MYKCDMELCIHNVNHKCLCEEISIDTVGLCTECTMPFIPQHVVEDYKKKTLKRLVDDRGDR